MMYTLIVPDNWATIEITNLTQGDALHQHNYSLMCTVQAIQGMNITPEVYWYSSNGTVIQTEGRFEIDTVYENSSVTTLFLTFSPVLHDQDGGVYSCRAQVTNINRYHGGGGGAHIQCLKHSQNNIQQL
jgi:hypothetical protein